jgi:uncharacterized membrane protein (DUF4010 family)
VVGAEAEAGWELLHGLAVALGVGLLMGMERERHQEDAADASVPAGVRSFALVGLGGWLAGLLGVGVVVVALAATAALGALAYWRTSRSDPGLTSEVALLLCCLIGAVAVQRPVLAAGVGVLAAVLLAAKRRLHKVSRELISEAELRDGLLLAAAALVVLPLLPNRPIDPLGVFNPAAVWRLVVLIMGMGAVGHFALRMLGARWGWAVAGFFSGYVSSTAAVASFAAESKHAERSAAGAALAANLASLSLFVPVLAAVSLPALAAVALAVGGAMLGLVVALGALYLWPSARRSTPRVEEHDAGRMFHPTQALLMAALLSAVVICAGLALRWLGSEAALLTAVVAGAVEVHSAIATLGQLHAHAALDSSTLRLGLVAILLVSAGVKCVLAFSGGTRAFGWTVSGGLAAMAGGGLLGAVLTS